MNKMSQKELWLSVMLPLCIMLSFLLVRLIFGTNELLSTGMALIAILCTRFLWFNPYDYQLFGIGLTMGLIVEVGFAQVHTAQFWEDASFFGVPYWLPLAWGLGFIVITRIGRVVREMNTQ